MKVSITEKQLKSVLKRAISESEGAQLINKMLTWSKDGNVDTTVDKSTDEPEKADTIGTDVKTYFKILAGVNEPLQQQKYGTMKWQQGVEATQMALIMLGYDLPKFGVDGLFGPETASAVKKYKKENDLLNESFKMELNEAELVQLKDTNYSHVKYDTDGTQNDYVNVHLLNDLQIAGARSGVVVKITFAKDGHGYYTKSGNVSRHTKNYGVDIGVLNGVGNGGATKSNPGNQGFIDDAYKLIDELKKLGYDCGKSRKSDIGCHVESGNLKAVLWQTMVGGNHFNHLHISNRTGISKEDEKILARTPAGKVPDGMVANISMATVSADLIAKGMGSGTPTSGPMGPEPDDEIKPSSKKSSSVDNDYESPSSSSSSEEKKMEEITPEMTDLMVKQLMDKGVTSDQLADLVDPAKVTGGSIEFTDLDLTTNEGVNAYIKICDNFINTRNPGGPVTGSMMVKGAKLALTNYQKYVPPELALAQLTLEGGLSKDDGEKKGNEKENKLNRPHKTKNPFNVGNTKTKDNPFATYQEGINAYYTLIARRYMANKKTAADLIKDFKNVNGHEYSGDYTGDYERDLSRLVVSIRKKNENIYKDLA